MSKSMVRLLCVLFIILFVGIGAYVFLSKDEVKISTYEKEKEKADMLVTFVLGEYNRQISANGTADIQTIVKDAKKLKTGSITILHKKNQPTIVFVGSLDRVLARLELGNS